MYSNILKEFVYYTSVDDISQKPFYDSISADSSDVILEKITRGNFDRFIDSLSDEDKSTFGKIKSLIGRGEQPVNIDKDAIMSEWVQKRKTTNLDEIWDIVSKYGVSKRQFKQSIEKFSTDDNPKLEKFAKAIINAGLKQEVIKYLVEIKGIKESIDINEAVLSQDTIKKVLSHVASISSNQDKKHNDNTYINDWYQNFKNESKVQKLRLSRELINYLYDRKYTQQHSAYVSYGVTAIKSSNLPENIKVQLIKMLRGGEPFTNVKGNKKDFIEDPVEPSQAEKYKARKDQEQSDGDINSHKNYISAWVDEFNKANLTGKVKLGKEAINYVSDRKDTPEFKFLVDTFSKVMRSSYIPNNIKKAYINALRTGKYYDMKVESIDVDRFLNIISESININTYGRIKR